MNLVFKVLFLFGYSFAFSAEPVRPLSIHDYAEANIRLTLENAVPIDGARVVWADFALLKRDFPQIAKLSDAEICDWLLKNFAFMGAEQVKLNNLRNSPISPGNRPHKNAYRPPSWERSAVMEAIDPDGKNVIGAVDIKGFGHGARSPNDVQWQVSNFKNAAGRQAEINKLRVRGHSDGLASLGEAIAETSRQRTAQMLFDMSDTQLETVENYAIIELPIKILKNDGHTIPAGMILRQAHFGRGGGLAVPNEIYTDDHGGKQKTSTDTAIDFGGVIIRDKRVARQFSAIDGSTDPQHSLPWKYAHETAHSVVFNNDIYGIYRHLDEMTSDIKSDYESSENVRIAKKRRAEIAQKVQTWRMQGETVGSILRKIKAPAAEAEVKSPTVAELKVVLAATDYNRQLSMVNELTHLSPHELKEFYDFAINQVKDEKVLSLLLESMAQSPQSQEVINASFEKLLEIFNTASETRLKNSILRCFGRVSAPAAVKAVLALAENFKPQQFSEFTWYARTGNEVSPKVLEFILGKGSAVSVLAIAKIKDSTIAENLIRKVWNSKNREMRDVLTTFLDKMPFSVSQNIIRFCLRSDELELFNRAVTAAKNFTLPERESLVIPWLAKSFNYPQWFQLLNILSDSTHPELLKLLKDRFINAHVGEYGQHAINSMIRRKDAFSTKYLYQVLESHAKGYLRISAMRGLAERADPAVIAKLKKFAFSKTANDQMQIEMRDEAIRLLKTLPGSIEPQELVTVLRAPKWPDLPQTTWIGFITAQASDANVELARNLIMGNLSVELVPDSEQVLLSYLIVNGRPEDLAITKSPKVQKVLGNGLIWNLRKRDKDNAAIPYILSAMESGANMSNEELMKLVSAWPRSGEILDRLQRLPQLDAEMQFWLYARRNPAPLSLRCPRLFR